MFDQHADEALDAAQDDPVQHDRPVLLAVFAHVRQVEPVRQGEIALDRGALPLPTDGVLQLHVDLGTVKGAVTLVNIVFQTLVVQGLDQGIGGRFPVRVAADAFFRPRGQFDGIFEAQRVHHVRHQVDDALDLVVHLVRPADEVRIILSELPHPGQAVQDAGLLVTHHRPQLEKAQGQIPVAPDLGLVYQHVGQAVHGLDAVALLVHLGEVHVFAIIFVVPGTLPKLGLEDLRTDDDLISAPQVFLAFEILEDRPQERALGVPDDHARAGFLVDGEQIQVLAQPSVVPLFGLFQEGQIGLKFFLAEISGAVDALEHLPVFVAAPVRARQTQQLERGHAAGVRNVRAPAEVHEFALLVNGYGLVGQVPDQFDLIFLAPALEKGDGVVPEHVPPGEPHVLLDDAGHLFFDAGQVFRREALRIIEIVVKTGVDGRTDGDLHPRKKGADRVGHDVRGGMPENVKSFRISGHYRGYLAALFDRPVRVDQAAVQANGNGFLGRILAQKGIQNVHGRRPRRHDGRFSVH